MQTHNAGAGRSVHMLGSCNEPGARMINRSCVVTCRQLRHNTFHTYSSRWYLVYIEQHLPLCYKQIRPPTPQFLGPTFCLLLPLSLGFIFNPTPQVLGPTFCLSLPLWHLICPSYSDTPQLHGQVALPLLGHGVLPGPGQVLGDGLQQGALLLGLQLPPLLGQRTL